MDGFRYLSLALGALGHLLTTAPVSFAARLAVGALFAAAGVYKLRHPLAAAVAAANFRVVTQPRKWVGYAVGSAESLTAFLLVGPWFGLAAAGSVLALGFSLGFAFITVRALLSGESFPCHCLSASGGDISTLTIVRALSMAAGVVIGAAGPIRGEFIPPVTMLAPAVGVAAALVGLPIAVHSAVVVWHSHRRLLAGADWEWLLFQSAGRGEVAAAPGGREGRSHAD